MGLFEMLLIAVVTLLVVGPQKMPEAVRSVALTMGRAKRMFNNARAEIEQQIGADDIRRELHNEAIMEQLAKDDFVRPSSDEPLLSEQSRDENAQTTHDQLLSKNTP